MGKRTIILLCGASFLLFLVSLFVYSQIGAQKDGLLTQAEFIDIIIRTLGLEDQLPVAATISDKIALLEHLGFAPPGGWEAGKILTKGDAAVVLAQILGVSVPVVAEQGYYVQVLADRSIMTAGDAELPFSMQDLTISFNIAASMPGTRVVPYIPPYKLPVSPTR